MMRNKIFLKILIISLLFFAPKVSAENIFYNIDTLIKENINYEEVFNIEITSNDSINELSKYVNVRELLIKNVNITDFNFIKNLNQLDKIEIYYSKVDLNNFVNSNVSEIKILNSYIQNDDLKGLVNASNLSILNLNGSYIKDIASIKYLTHINELSISSISNLKSLKPITYLKNLSVLNLNGSENLIDNDVLNFIKKNNIIGTNYDSKKYAYFNGSMYDNELNKIISSLKLDNLSNLEKIKSITLYVVDNMSYDDNCLTKEGCTNKDINFNFIATSLSFKGVCYHYALLEAKLLNKVGIDSYLVSGFSNKNLGHEWVHIYFDDKWYAIDPTWIDTKSLSDRLRNTGKTNYYMVDLSDKNVSDRFYKEHIPNVIPNNIVDVNASYKEENIIDNDLVYTTTFIVLICILTIFVLYNIIVLIIKRKNINKKK